MTKTELVKRVAAETGFTRNDCDKVMTALLGVITEALVSGEIVKIVGFGVFEVVNRTSRIGRNPATGEPVNIPAKRVPVFKSGRELKEAVRNS